MYQKQKVKAVPINKEPILVYQGAVNAGRGFGMRHSDTWVLPLLRLVIIGNGDIFEDLKKEASTCHGKKELFSLTKWSRRSLANTATARYGLNLLDASSLSYYYSLANKFFWLLASKVSLRSIWIYQNIQDNPKWESRIVVIPTWCQATCFIDWRQWQWLCLSKMKDNCLIVSDKYIWSEAPKLLKLFEGLNKWSDKYEWRKKGSKKLTREN